MDDITVTWSAEDGEWVATCARYPSLSWLAATAGEAWLGLRLVIGIIAKEIARG